MTFDYDKGCFALNFVKVSNFAKLFYSIIMQALTLDSAEYGVCRSPVLVALHIRE